MWHAGVALIKFDHKLSLGNWLALQLYAVTAGILTILKRIIALWQQGRFCPQ